MLQLFIIAYRLSTGHMVRGADIIDHLDEPLVARRVGGLQGELRADQHQRNARGVRRRNAGLYGGAKHRLVDADDRVVGADLPDDQPRPAGLQRAFQAVERLGGKFATDAGVLDVEVRPRPLFELLPRAGPDRRSRANSRRCPRLKTSR